MIEQETPDAEQSDRLDILIAVLIALVSIIGAVVAWRASVSADGAGDADVAGLRATINLTETRALGAVNAYDDYGSFVTYFQHTALLNELLTDSATLPQDETADLTAQIADEQDGITLSADAFPNQYLNRDGTYALSRQIGEQLADAARTKDVNPAPSYAEADELRIKTNKLLVSFSVLTIALVFYTFIEVIGSRWRVFLTVMGTLLLVAGTIGAFLVETGRL